MTDLPDTCQTWPRSLTRVLPHQNALRHLPDFAGRSGSDPDFGDTESGSDDDDFEVDEYVPTTTVAPRVGLRSYFNGNDYPGSR